MANESDEFISNPFSTGGGGVNFEFQVQTSFVVLMLAGGFSPCLPCRPIQKVKLQGRYSGYNTDDLIVFTSEPDGSQPRKLFGQIKHQITISESNETFKQVIKAAWKDFQNESIFSKNKDVLALVTGPLSARDIEDVRTVLEWARHSESAADFLTKVETANFSSDTKRAKTRAFRSSLTEANGEEVSDEAFFSFLRHYHLLGYDLDIKSGVMHAILHSIIGQHSSSNTAAVWAQILQEVMFANHNAGTIEVNTLPPEIRDIFKKQKIDVIPEEFTKTTPPKEIHDWNTSEFAQALVVANLLGSWNEKSDADMAIAKKLCDGQYEKWIPQLRKVLQLNDSPLSLRNGIWAVKDRDKLWRSLGPSLFDRHLDILKECALDVLRMPDPQFELPPEERYAASIHGKILPHSVSLRKGLAESLAILGSLPEALDNCSLNKAEVISLTCVREIFNKSDGVLWGSLNDLLPLLAEASPQEFLAAVENAVAQVSCPFDLLFVQEGKGITGRSYISGLLWALETLAWSEEFLVRVTVILGSLEVRDPGGQWTNRPINSLIEIFLPWLPQTTASIEKRKAAVQTLKREYPETAGKLLIKLMPDQFSSSSHTHRPSWRKFIPVGWKEGVNQKEYRDQVTIYSEIATNIAISNDTILLSLIPHLDHFPQEAFQQILGHISSEEMTKKPEDEKRKLWEKLLELARKHRLYHDTDWAMPKELVEQIEKAATNVAPHDPMYVYQKLFAGRDWELYEERSNWQHQEKIITERKKKAVEEILQRVKFEGLIEFSRKVESPYQVGLALGVLNVSEYDHTVLPSMLNSETPSLQQFAEGYVKGRFNQENFPWVDTNIRASWNKNDIGKALSFLPFVTQTWERVESLLGPDQTIYWKSVAVNPYLADKDLNFAIDKLIKNNRPWAAIDCLAKIVRDNEELDKKLAVEALVSSAYSTTERTDIYDAIEVIKVLQNDSETSSEDLFKIEWLFLPALKGNGENEYDVSPKTLNNRLASDPSFFNEAIRIAYKSDKASDATSSEPSEQQRALALNAYRLLHQWRIVPGTNDAGEFCGAKFKEWIEYSVSLANQSGHLAVSLVHIGGTLIESAGDQDGLWLHHDIAEVLNRPEMEDMRRGYSTAIHNSRGVHWVDPTGAPELDLAKFYKERAELIENAGYHRIAATLRDVATSYEREARRIITDQDE